MNGDFRPHTAGAPRTRSCMARLRAMCRRAAPRAALLVLVCVLPQVRAHAAAAAPPAAPAQAQAPITDPVIEAFAELPQLNDLQVSPDGKRIAMLSPLRGVFGLVVLDVATRKSNIALAADPARFHISNCRWANETRLVCQVRSVANLPVGGTPVRMMATAMIAVDHDGTHVLELLNDRRARAWDRIERGTYISLLPGDREHILVPMLDPKQIRALEWYRDPERVALYPEAWLLNIYDDTHAQALRARNNVSRWVADPDGEIRLGLGIRDRGLHAVAREDGWLRNLELGALAQEQDLELLHLARGGSHALIAARAGGDRRAVHEFDIATAKIVRTLYAHPRFDFDGRVQVLGGEAQGLLVSDEVVHLEPLTDGWRTLKATLDRALPGQNAIPWSWSDDGTIFAVRTHPTQGVSEWYLYDRPAERLLRIGAELPKLQALWNARAAAGRAPPSARWVSYTARDGREIPALLTLPPADATPPARPSTTGQQTDEGARHLPTIVLPHGGPIARDGAVFDFVAAFLVERGYAVLQPQFRGSFGYGAQFIQAGFGQWGLQMQDDLVDGLAWLRARGIAHPQDACMVGLSYGGYAALVSAYKTPGLVRCAASYAGVTDLPMLLRNRNLYRFDERTMKYMLLSMNRSVLEPNSPAQNVAAFGVPVLLMHADQDVNVLVEQSRTLAAALAAAGKPHRYVELQDGDHHMGVQAHRTQWLTELDAFLKANLREHAAP